MKKNRLYLYFGINYQAAGFIYHKKQSIYHRANFFNLSNENLFFITLSKLFSNSKYNSVLNRVFLVMIFDQLSKIFIAFLCFLYRKKTDNKLYVISNDYISIYLALFSKLLYKNKIHLCGHDLPWTFFYNNLSSKFLKFYYGFIIRRFDTFDFTTYQMKDVFERNYNLNIKDYVITHSGIDLMLDYENENENKVQEFELTSFSRNTEIRFLYLGSIRFKKELQELVSCLETKKINFSIDLYSSINPLIEGTNYKGFINDINKLNFDYYDFGIVPLSHLDKDKALVQTSFPGKTSAYLSNNLPLIIISPKYSALANSLKKYNIGIEMSQLETNSTYEFDIKKYRNFIYDNYKKLKLY